MNLASDKLRKTDIKYFKNKISTRRNGLALEFVEGDTKNADILKLPSLKFRAVPCSTSPLSTFYHTWFLKHTRRKLHILKLILIGSKP